MKRVALCLVFVFVWTTTAASEPVRSGNHPQFVRLVIPIPESVNWQVGRVSEGFGVRFDQAVDIDLTGVFDRIPRNRIAEIEVQPDGLEILSVCECHADAFLWQPDRLVVDIVDGPAPTESAFDSSLDQVMVSEGVEQPDAPALVLPILPFWPEAASSPLGDLPDPFRSEDERAWTAEAEAAILTGLANAATAGLLDIPIQNIAQMIVEEDGVGVTRTQPPDLLVPGAVAPVDVVAETGSPGLRLRDAMVTDEVTEPGMSPAVACHENRNLDLHNWGDDRPYHVQIAERRAALTGEFDRFHEGAIDALAQTYLYFGFGREARRALELDGARSTSRLLLDAIGSVMDDMPPETGILSDQLSCTGAVSLWAALALGDAREQPEQARLATVQAFRVLPAHLRAQIGPRLSRLYVQADDPLRADAILELTRKHRESGDITTELAEADVAGALGGEDAKADALDQLAEGNARMTPDALAELLDIRRGSGSEVDPALLELADALLFEARPTGGNVALARAVIRRHVEQPDFDAAQAILDATDFSDPDRAELVNEIITAKTVALPDTSFLTFAFARLPSEATDGTENRVAERVLALGFPERALQLVQGEAAREDLAERRYLRAQAHGALGETDAMEEALSGMTDARAEAIRIAAYSNAGDYVTALEQALGQEEEDAEPIAWRAGALSLIETSDDPLLARASQNALEALAISPDLSDLAAREALLTEASETREITEALLQRFTLEEDPPTDGP